MQLVLRNFKNHTLWDRDFTSNVVISGRNGAGKTSILEAIIFALTGRDFYGAVGVDRFVQDGEPESLVVLKLGDIEIKRIISKKGKAASVKVYLNSVESSQVEIEAIVGSLQTTLAAINPMYFSSLTDTEQRGIFTKLMPLVDRRKIFMDKYKDEELAKQFELSSPSVVKTAYKNILATLESNKILRENLNEQKRNANVELSIVNKDILEDPEKYKPQDTKAIEEYDLLSNQISRLEALKDEKITTETELQALVNKVTAELTRHKRPNLSVILKDLDDRILELTKQKGEANRNISMYLENQKLFEAAKLTGECPICGSKITSDHVLHQDAGSKIEELEKIRDDLEKKESATTQVYQQFNKWKEQAGVLKDRLAWRYKDIEKLPELIERKSKIQLVGDPKDMEIYELHLGAVGKKDQLEKNIKLLNGKLASLDEQEEKLKPVIVNYEVLLDAFGTKGVDSEVARLQSLEINKMISKYIDGVEVITARENKSNDGWKEVFDIYRNGIEYRSLSMGEQMRISVILSMVLRDLQPRLNENFNFILLDETSILSDNTLTSITTWAKKKKINLIITKVSNGEFSAKAFAKNWFSIPE